MSGSGALVQLGLPRAHPVSGHPHVDVPVLLVVVSLTAAVVLALFLTPQGRAAREPGTADASSWAGTLDRGQLVTRALAVALLVLAVAAGRFGSQVELENLAPALVIGAGWPLLTAASLVLPAWRWVDPWDTLARMLSPGDASEPPGHVWPAVVLAFPLAWFVAVYERPLDPRAVGLVLLVYTTLTLAGCLVSGRRRWLSSSEPIGILLTWVYAAARARLGAADLPRGSTVLLGGSLGAMLFAVLRRTGFWSRNVPLDATLLFNTAGLLVCGALGAGLVALGASLERRLGPRSGAVVCGVAPALAGVVLALALERNRLFTSVQLLPGLAGDPFGAGWDLLGPAAQGLDADPLGAAGLLAAQLAVLGVGLVWGAVVAGRRSSRGGRTAAAVVLGYLAAVASLIVSLH